VFAHNDDLALGVLQALRELGLDCPRDVAVAGYNDTYLCAHLVPTLTSIRWPAAEVGRTAAQLALTALSYPTSGAPATVRFAPDLVVRDSTSASATHR
jgi:LacI family transcriptional regulator